MQNDNLRIRPTKFTSIYRHTCVCVYIYVRIYTHIHTSTRKVPFSAGTRSHAYRQTTDTVKLVQSQKSHICRWILYFDLGAKTKLSSWATTLLELKPYVLRVQHIYICVYIVQLSLSLIKHCFMKTLERHVGEWIYSSTILDLGTKWRWLVSFTPGRITLGTHWIEAGWAPELIWKLWRRENFWITGQPSVLVSWWAKRHWDRFSNILPIVCTPSEMCSLFYQLSYCHSLDH
jgi:hypothetical protein